MAVKIEHPNVLVVEGKEEELFFGALIKYLRLQNIQVVGIGGKTNLRQNLKALTLSPRFPEVTSLGVVRDANANPGAAFQSVCDALQAAELPAPECPLKLTGHRPKVAILILPKGDERGTLEDLCLRAVAADPAMLCVNQYFHCLEDQGLFLPSNASKAKVQVFLASRAEAGKRLGEAAQAGYWPLEDLAFEQVRNFLQQICS